MPRKTVRAKKQTTAAATKSSSNENKPVKSNENKQPALNSIKPPNENKPTNLNAKALADEPSKSAPEKTAKPVANPISKPVSKPVSRSVSSGKLIDFLKSPNGTKIAAIAKSTIDEPTAAAKPAAVKPTGAKPANGTKATNSSRSAKTTTKSATKSTAKSTTSKSKPSSKKTPSSGKKKESAFDKSTNHLITEYYKVTKRKTSNKLREEQEQLISHYIKNDIDDIESLKIEHFENKGRGIVTSRRFPKGTFICEYRGDLIDIQKAKEREQLYESQQLGCYMYYFSWSNKQWCIDATVDTGRLGRLINHSRKRPNLRTRLFILNNEPHLIFVALDDIEENTELLYDYGETNRGAIEANPWIKST